MLAAASLFKFVWPFGIHQALKGQIKPEFYPRRSYSRKNERVESLFKYEALLEIFFYPRIYNFQDILIEVMKGKLKVSFLNVF